MGEGIRRDPSRDHMLRVAVVGTSGSGKTTFARALAAALGSRHVELDALHWGPAWTPAPPDTFRSRVEAVVRQARWVIDGNYGTVRDLVWRRATALVWLDYSFPLVFARAIRRTATRLVTQEELFAGNRESLRMSLGREGIPCWVLRSYWRRRREYPDLVRRPEYAHLDVHRIARPREAVSFLDACDRLEAPALPQPRGAR